MRLSREPLLSAEVIRERVAGLGEEISAAYEGRALHVLVVLKGALVFAADLVRYLPDDTVLDFVRAKSYTGTESQGTVEFTYRSEGALLRANVILVEDILDTGRTASGILEWVQSENPASVAVCSLLDKPARRVVGVSGDFVGFEIEDQFVVGYGLDYEERYRTLPGVYLLEKD
jgi:hypoxanthine phosphoribosyltransferase